MSGATTLILYVIVIIAVIVLSQITKINVGVLGLVGAVILGIFVCGLKMNDVVNFWPINSIFILIFVNMFYGFANTNGTMVKLGQKIIYSIRKWPVLVPFSMYFIYVIVCGLGAGVDATPMILGPIAYSLAAQLGFHPIIVAISSALGNSLGGDFPWTAYGPFWGGIFEPACPGGFEEGMRYVNGTLIFFFIVSFIVFLLACILTKAYKIKPGDVLIREPEPFDPKQKETLIVVLVVLGILLVPNMLNQCVSVPAISWIAANIDVRVLSVFGIVYMILRKLGSIQEVMTKSIPWNVIVLMAGMTCLTSLARPLGVIDYLSTVLAGLPGGIALAAVALICGLLSMVTNGVTVAAMFVPLTTALAESTSLPVGAFLIAMAASFWTTCVSPISTGGAMAMATASNEQKEVLVKSQTIAAFGGLAVLVILCLLRVPVLFA